jgi:hypothetical protein
MFFGLVVGFYCLLVYFAFSSFLFAYSSFAYSSFAYSVEEILASRVRPAIATIIKKIITTDREARATPSSPYQRAADGN